MAITMPNLQKKGEGYTLLSEKKQLLILYKTTTAFQQTLDFSERLDIGIATFQSVGFDRVRIYLYDEQSNTLMGKKCVGIDEAVFKEIRFEVPPKSKIEMCIKKRKPVVKCTKTDSIFGEILEKSDVPESLSLPLISKDKVIGIVSLDNKYSHNKLHLQRLEFFMVLANHLALALDNALLYRKNVEELHRITALYDVTNTLSSTLDLDTVLNLIAIRIGKITKCNICSILLVDDAKEFLLPTAVYTQGANYPWHGKKIEVHKSVGSAVFRTHQRLYLQNIQEDPRFMYKDFARTEDLRALVSLPLMVGHEMLGLINLYFRREKESNDLDTLFLTALCNQAAVIIRNSKLYDRIEEDKDKLSELLQIIQTINAMLEPQELLKLLLEKTVNFTHADYGLLHIIKDKRLDVIYSKGHTKDTVHTKEFKIGKGLTGWVAVHGKPVVVDDVTKDKRYAETRPETRSEADIPLIRKGRIIGVLNLESKHNANFSPYRKSLEILTNLIAVAIENAWYYEDITSFNQRLRTEIEIATEELRQKNRELQKMDHIKSDLISNVSHELRTPLTSIAGYTKLMLHEKTGPLVPSQKECLKIINGETDRLTRLITNLLDVSRLESGKIRFKAEAINLKAIAQHIIEIVRPSAEEKKLTLRITCPEEIPLVMGNSDLLNQVYTNLIGNAIKFTEPGGEITIGIRIEKNTVESYVQDTGQGIKKEDIPKLFERFYQVDSSSTRVHGGTGLGLAIVKHIISAHNGKIWCESEVGKGTRFVFQLRKI